MRTLRGYKNLEITKSIANINQVSSRDGTELRSHKNSIILDLHYIIPRQILPLIVFMQPWWCIGDLKQYPSKCIISPSPPICHCNNLSTAESRSEFMQQTSNCWVHAMVYCSGFQHVTIIQMLFELPKWACLEIGFWL